MADDDFYYPQQFGLGSLYNLQDPPHPPAPRLAGLRSVKNLRGGIVAPAVRSDTEYSGYSGGRMGFHCPTQAITQPVGFKVKPIVVEYGGLPPLVKPVSEDLQDWIDRVLRKSRV